MPLYNLPQSAHLKNVGHMAVNGENMVVVEFDEYKGNKLIVLKRDENDKYPFKFGLGKARLIVEACEDIKKFVDESESGVEGL